jgi:hypothetical protein
MNKKTEKPHVLIQCEVEQLPLLRALGLKVTHMPPYLSSSRADVREQHFALSRSMARRLRDALDRALARG